MSEQAVNSTNEIDQSVIGLATQYTNEELVKKIQGQFTHLNMVLEVLRVLVDDNASGTDRSQARERGRIVVKFFDEALESAEAEVDALFAEETEVDNPEE